MPLTWPRIQLLGRGFGQDGSTRKRAAGSGTAAVADGVLEGGVELQPAMPAAKHKTRLAGKD